MQIGQERHDDTKIRLKRFNNLPSNSSQSIRSAAGFYGSSFFGSSLAFFGSSFLAFSSDFLPCFLFSLFSLAGSAFLSSFFASFFSPYSLHPANGSKFSSSSSSMMCTCFATCFFSAGGAGAAFSLLTLHSANGSKFESSCSSALFPPASRTGRDPSPFGHASYFAGENLDTIIHQKNVLGQISGFG